MTVKEQSRCPSCGAIFDESGFCGSCGEATTLVQESGRSRSGDSADSLGESRQTGNKKSRKGLLGGVVAGTLLVAMAAAAFLWVEEDNKRKAAAEAEAQAISVVQSSFDELATVTNTAEVRAIAAQAETYRQSLVVNEASPPAVTAAEETLTDIATLSGLNGDTLKNWPAWRDEIASSAASVATDQARVSADAGLASVDQVVTVGQQRLDEWGLKELEAGVANQARLAELQQYSVAVTTELDAYDELRNETNDWVNRSLASGSSFNSVAGERFISQAIADRRAVRGVLGSLQPPPELAAQHNELLGLLDEAISAMTSLESGVAALEDCRRDCALDDAPGYSSFQRTSQSITPRYDRASASLRSSLVSVQRELETFQTSPKPEV